MADQPVEVGHSEIGKLFEWARRRLTVTAITPAGDFTGKIKSIGQDLVTIQDPNLPKIYLYVKRCSVVCWKIDFTPSEASNK